MSAQPGIDGLHQVLDVREDVGVGFVTVLGDYFSVDNDVEFAVGPRG